MDALLKYANERQAKRIKEEIDEDEEVMENNLKAIKEWVKFNNHLPQNCGDKILISFLRGCKHNLEKTQKKLKTYFVNYCTNKELILNRNVLSIKTISYLEFAILPKLTPGGQRVFVFKLTDPNSSSLDVLQFYRFITFAADFKLAEDNFTSGEIIIIDSMLGTLSHGVKFLTLLTKRALKFYVETYPVRLKAIHIVNPLPFINTFINTLRPYMKDKIFSRLHFHKGHESLADHVPLKCLPSDYGGTQKPMVELDKLWKEEMSKRIDLYEANMKLNGSIVKL